jgi:hypothetical protein
MLTMSKVAAQARSGQLTSSHQQRASWPISTQPPPLLDLRTQPVALRRQSATRQCRLGVQATMQMRTSSGQY